MVGQSSVTLSELTESKPAGGACCAVSRCAGSVLCCAGDSSPFSVQSKTRGVSAMLSQRLVIKSKPSCVPRSLLSMSHCSLTGRITS